MKFNFLNLLSSKIFLKFCYVKRTKSFQLHYDSNLKNKFIKSQLVETQTLFLHMPF